MTTLVLEKVDKSFNGKTLLDAVDFVFEGPALYIIRGESGTGKTTLLNMIAGYLPTDRGVIRKDTGGTVAYLFQEDMLFSNLTVMENLYLKYFALFPDTAIADDRFLSSARSLLEEFGMASAAERKISLLSGGERQRVKLASILLTNPDIILLDEPVSRLDQKNKTLIMNIITERLGDKLVIIASHENHDIRGNVRNIRLEDGKLRK